MEREEMKKFVFGLCFVFLTVVLSAQTRKPIAIDEAISKSANAMSQWVDRIEMNFDRKGLIISGVSPNTSPSLYKYIVLGLREELQNYGVNYVDRVYLEESQKRLLDDFNTRRISDASAVPGSELIAVRFIIYTICEKVGDNYDYSLELIDTKTQRALISRFTVKNDFHVRNIIKNDNKSDTKLPILIASKLPIAAGNIFLGAGSLFTGDFRGWGVIALGEVAAFSLIMIEINELEYKDTLAGVIGPIGVAVGGLTLLYGFIRPYTYSKNPRLAEIADNVQITVIPDDKSMAVNLSYKIKF